MGTRTMTAVVTAIALVACASDAEPAATDPPITSPAPTPAPTTTEAAATTTTEATTTTLAPTTTTAPTTTSAPTTTVDPLEQLAAEIERDLNLGEQALLAAVADPGNLTLRTEVERYFGDEALERVKAILDGLESEGLRARPNPDRQSILTVVRLADLPNGAASDALTAEVCRVDAGVVYEPLPDGGEVVVNDQVRVVISLSPIRLVDGTWALQGGDLLETLGPESQCPER